MTQTVSLTQTMQIKTMPVKKVKTRDINEIVKSATLTQEKNTRGQGSKSWKTATAR